MAARWASARFRRQIFFHGGYVSVSVARNFIGRHAGQRVVASHVHFRDWRVCRANVSGGSNCSNPLGQTLYPFRIRGRGGYP